MAKSTAHDQQRHAIGEQPRRMGVSQVVEARTLGQSLGLIGLRTKYYRAVSRLVALAREAT
jgi:hypothetical protein